MVGDMPSLITGLVRAGGYADKVRRTLFAQLKNDIKSGRIDPQQVAYRAGRLNEVLFRVLVELLGIDKRDVVRISINYELTGGDIVFDWDTLSIEVYPFSEELSRKATEEAKKFIREGLVDYDFEIEKTGETGPTTFYDVKLNGEKVGAVALLDVGESLAVSGAIVIDGKGYKIGGFLKKSEPVDVGIKRLVNEAIINKNEISVDEAEKIISKTST
jgi:hypothetical protein